MFSPRSNIAGRVRTARGHTLAELAVALSLTAIASTAVLAGSAALRNAVNLSAGRQQLAAVLEYARRESYRRAQTAQVGADAAGRALVVRIAGLADQRFDLVGGRIVAAPSRGHVSFFESGLAENATFTIAGDSGRTYDVIVNQRGEIR